MTYKIYFDGYKSNSFLRKNRIHIDVFIENFQKELRLWDSPSYNHPFLIADGISECSAKAIEEHINSFGGITDIQLSDLTEYSEQEEKISNYFKKLNAPVTCPRCGSNQITTGQRGFNIVTGFIGSNQTVNRCAKCGYSWKP